MKTFTKIASTSALLLAIAAPAAAAPNANLLRDVQWAAGGNTNVTFEVTGDTITMNGAVENKFTLDNIVKAAEANGAEANVRDVLILR